MRNSHAEALTPWADRTDRVEVRFFGHEAPRSNSEMALALGEPDLELAWLEQVHSNRVLTARPGFSGTGDALVTRRRRLALSIGTADCAPLLLAAGEVVAAAHAGWRGVVAGVVADAVSAIVSADGPPSTAIAWIGPTIGACCYEVGDEIAEQVARASADNVVLPGPGSRPHLDLRAAVHAQLRTAGIAEIRHTDVCTRCAARRLSSYRRDGADAGRNLSVIWLR